MTKKKKKKLKINNKTIFIIAIIAIFMLFNQKQPTEVPPQQIQPVQPGCTNICTLGYNQRPYPNCNCYIPQPTSSDNDGDGIPDSQDNDDDNDGFSDQEETDAGTDPLNPNDYPQTAPVGECNMVSMDCGISCSNMGYNIAYCTIESCPPNYDYIGDYACSDNPPCQICCCSYVEPPVDDDEPEDEGPECSDSDWSGNTPYPEESALSTQSFTYGYVIHNMEGYSSPIYDTCQGAYVYERFCNHAGYLDFDLVYCEDGCSGGKCNSPPPPEVNPVCGHSVGQHCYGYDVAYHSSTSDSTKCNQFPKFEVGTNCLYGCIYKGLDNYDMHCWCWDTDVCESYQSCGSSGCYGSYESCSDVCVANGRSGIGCRIDAEYCATSGGNVFSGGDDCASGAVCCCGWSNVYDACESYGYTTGSCFNANHFLVEWPDDCYNDPNYNQNMPLPAGDHLCGHYGEPGLDMRLCCHK